jgi:mono/diheme cytochrome c family protein
MKKRSIVLSVGMLALLSASAWGAVGTHNTDAAVERGRYIVRTSGCNDCHTPHYAEQGGDVPEAQWLVGDTLGWRGPWGTTYPANLRLYMQGLSEREWLKKAHTLSTRPPMPWFNVRAMSDRDLRALYRYVRHLGAAGTPAPAYVPPEGNPSQPYVQFPASPK